MADEISVTTVREDKYRFTVDFGAAFAPLTADEPPPLGDDAGPSPSQLLAAAVANCMSASFLFATGKFKEDPGRIVTKATCQFGRNERNRRRVIGIKVEIQLGEVPEAVPHLDRVLAQFEDFCTVSQSVQSGIPLEVSVLAPDGRVLK